MQNQLLPQTSPSLEIPAEIRVFLESMLKDANMMTLDDDTREEMIKELFVRLDQYINSVIVDKLPPEYLDEFIKLNEEKKSKAEIEQYLKDKLPNNAEIFAKAFADFRQQYLGGVTLSRNLDSAKAETKIESATMKTVN